MFAILLSEKMDPFYQNITSFPTVFFTFFLLLVTLYWVVAVLGFVDINVLDIDIHDGDSSSPDVLAGLLLRFGLQDVPVVIILSIMSMIGWVFSYYIVHFLFGFIPDGVIRFLVSLPVILMCIYMSALVTAVLIKPVRPFFKKTQQHAEKHILGQTVVVRTSKVDGSFGEGVLDDGGAGLILKIRDSANNNFKSGDKVVLFDYLSEENAYRVISEKEFFGQ